MATAVYPLGMKEYNNYVNTGGYVTWKGSGVNSNPVGITAGTIRPLTNNDIHNSAPTGFGLPRPIKHFRKGRAFPNTILINNPNTPTEYIEVPFSRAVASSSGGNLVKQLIDIPGGFAIAKNPANEQNNIAQLNTDCKSCNGIGVISSFYPNESYLTENPTPTTETPAFCCNEERKARRRARPCNTNLPKGYYTRHQEYMENRCQSYEQKSFNYQTNKNGNNLAKPGSARAIDNTYAGNCIPGTPKSCNPVVYKPSNPQFATQGAVSSSTRMLKLNRTTIDTNLASFNNNTLGQKLSYADGHCYGNNNVPFILKNKVEPIRPTYYLRNGDKKSCFTTAV